MVSEPGGGRGSVSSLSPGAHLQDRHSCLPVSEPLLAPSCFISSKFPGDVNAAGLGAALRKAETEGPELTLLGRVGVTVDSQVTPVRGHHTYVFCVILLCKHGQASGLNTPPQVAGIHALPHWEQESTQSTTGSRNPHTPPQVAGIQALRYREQKSTHPITGSRNPGTPSWGAGIHTLHHGEQEAWMTSDRRD